MDNKFWKWLLASFDTDTKGASSRKLTAFVIVCCIVAAHISWLKHSFMHDDFSLLIPVLYADYFFISVLFSLTTWSTPKQNGNQDDPKNPAA